MKTRKLFPILGAMSLLLSYQCGLIADCHTRTFFLTAPEGVHGNSFNDTQAKIQFKFAVTQAGIGLRLGNSSAGDVVVIEWSYLALVRAGGNSIGLVNRSGAVSIVPPNADIETVLVPSDGRPLMTSAEYLAPDSKELRIFFPLKTGIGSRVHQFKFGSFLGDEAQHAEAKRLSKYLEDEPKDATDFYNRGLATAGPRRTEGATGSFDFMKGSALASDRLDRQSVPGLFPRSRSADPSSMSPAGYSCPTGRSGICHNRSAAISG
jgi:hypothetical protein